VINFREQAGFDKDAAIICLTKQQLASANFSHLRNQTLAALIKSTLKASGFDAKAQQTFPFVFKKTLILLAGVGDAEKLTGIELRSALRQALLSPHLKKSRTLEIVPFSQDKKHIRAVIEGVLLGAYSWKKYKADEFSSKKQIFIAAPKNAANLETVTICEGVNFARDLINDNADLITAEYFEKTIRGLIRGRKNVRMEVLGRKQLRAQGLNLHLAVNQGSRKEPRLIIVRYTGAGAKHGCTALVGKGLTFDTGGLNLKPTGSMETMRSDMSGAAAIVATLKNAVALKLKKNIIFAVAMAENAIGSGAYKPGDVFRGYNGKTVEIKNTDAEGRLVLADAIAYIVKNYKPARLVDIATLTGACVIALGYDHTGLIANDDKLAEEILAASRVTDDRAWRLPNYPELKDAIKSDIADLKNNGWPKGAAGTLTAAEFLRQFTGDVPWAHLDIAGTSFLEGQPRGYFATGATGAGVRLLTEFIKNL